MSHHGVGDGPEMEASVKAFLKPTEEAEAAMVSAGIAKQDNSKGDIDKLREALFDERPDAMTAGDELHSEMYPDGKISEDDDGMVMVSVGTHIERRRVVLKFERTIAWIGFTPEQAIDIGEAILAKARLCMGQT